MKIGLSENTIVLDGLEQLKKYQISQLRFYGFNSTSGLYKKNSENIEADILKVISYLELENISIELTPNIREILLDAQAKNKKQQELFNLAKKIKQGEIDSVSFEKFNAFLNSLPRKLKKHQIKAAYHLYTLKNGANYSVPGSGKTSVVLSVYEMLRSENHCNVLFVVGPPACFQPWQHEFEETLGRCPTTTILSGGNKRTRKLEYYSSTETNPELFLSTFQTLMNDVDDVIVFLRQRGRNVYFVVDEAHYMKRVDGNWANALLKIADHTQYRCILTGTPIPKGYEDLFNQFDFLWPNNHPLSVEDKLQITLWEEQKEDKAVKKLLDEKIGALFYRVRKQDLGLKPANFHEPIIVQMKPHEHRIYELIKSKIYELSKSDFLENQEILNKLWKGRMMRLRQSVSHPKLLSRTIENYDEDLLYGNSELADLIQNYDNLETTGKLDALTQKVVELNNAREKVLIWSNFIGTLEMLKSHFASLNLKSEIIYGKTPRKNDVNEMKDVMTREKIRDIFVDPNSNLDILIANPAALAESVSLHKTCFNAIYFDLSYNCAQYLQSLDRIHRVGGSETKTANYYFLQYSSSIDQDIKQNLEFKAQKMYSIIEQDYEIYNLDIFDDDEDDDDDITAYKRLFVKTDKRA